MIGLSTTHTLSSFTLAAGDASTGNLVRHFVQGGGIITWFVLIPLSVATIALALNFLIVLRRSVLTPAPLAKALLAAARQGQTRNLLEITREDSTMLGQAAFAGFSQLSSGRSSARAAIDEAVDERAGKLFRKIEFLNVIGNISPMLGLLGTVIGMIKAFSRIEEAGGGMPEAGLLAGDISLALVTTFWGILIAIPALTAYSVFRNRIDGYAAECVKMCDGFVALADSQQDNASE